VSWQTHFSSLTCVGLWGWGQGFPFSNLGLSSALNSLPRSLATSDLGACGYIRRTATRYRRPVCPHTVVSDPIRCSPLTSSFTATRQFVPSPALESGTPTTRPKNPWALHRTLLVAASRSPCGNNGQPLQPNTPFCTSNSHFCLWHGCNSFAVAPSIAT